MKLPKLNKLLVYRIDLEKTFKEDTAKIRWHALGKEVKEVIVTPHYVDIIYWDKTTKWKVI